MTDLIGKNLLALDEVEIYILRDALRQHRYTRLAEREAMKQSKVDDPNNPEWANNEEWIARTEDLEKRLDVVYGG